MKPICLIPARAGSKGLPNKNMLFLDGKPMIFHTIDAAIESGCFEKENIYVSTDSLIYKEICETRGIKVLIRPDELSTDYSTSYDFTEHFLKDFEDNQVFVLLQITSPLRNGKNIKEALEIYNQKEAENVVSFSKIEKSPKFFTEIDENGFAKDICGVDKGYRRQNDTKELFAPNGAIYITSKKAYLTNKSYFTKKTKAYIMQKEDSIDVDDRLDFTSVIGRIYFDYKRREQKNKKLYTTKYKQLIKNNKHSNIILGDSKSTDLKIPNFENYSLAGISTAVALENIDLITSQNIKNIIISLGINDLIAKYDINTITNNYKKLLEKLIQKNIKINIVEISLTLFRDSINNDRVIKLNNELINLAKKLNIHYIKINNELTKNNHLKFEYTLDGLHYNEKGQDIYNNIIKNNIKF